MIWCQQNLVIYLYNYWMIEKPTPAELPDVAQRRRRRRLLPAPVAEHERRLRGPEEERRRIAQISSRTQLGYRVVQQNFSPEIFYSV